MIINNDHGRAFLVMDVQGLTAAQVTHCMEVVAQAMTAMGVGGIRSMLMDDYSEKDNPVMEAVASAHVNISNESGMYILPLFDTPQNGWIIPTESAIEWCKRNNVAEECAKGNCT